MSMNGPGQQAIEDIWSPSNTPNQQDNPPKKRVELKKLEKEKGARVSLTGHNFIIDLFQFFKIHGSWSFFQALHDYQGPQGLTINSELITRLMYPFNGGQLLTLFAYGCFQK